MVLYYVVFFIQAEDGIRDLVRSRGLGDVYKRQDQAHPAVSRSHVTWLQGDEQGLRVMAADLETLTPFPVAAVEKAFSAGRPVISDQYIVWSEIGSAQASRLVAYDLGTRQTTVVTSLMSPQASYAIEGSVVVWADPDVRVRDLATGIEDRIDTGRAANIAIAEKITTWAAPVSYTHLRAHETVLDLVCRLLLEKKTKQNLSLINTSNTQT